ncbi:MAG: transglutaminase-like domain-containing protein [Anaerolineales bacterium]
MNITPSSELLKYYATPGPFTDPAGQAHLFDGLPSEIGELCRVVQNNLLHIFWADRYGRTLSDKEKETVNVRSARQKLNLMQTKDPRPLPVPRILELRQIGNCRDFSVMLAAILRHQGVPARARCGFGAYFLPDHFEDHWVCEYWHADRQRWVLVDAQLDEFQCRELGVTFDPLDVPRDQFIVAGQAWQMCRHGQADPRQFGIFEWHGWWFIWGNVIRELLAFNKIELLPWDYLPNCMTHQLEDPLPETTELAWYDGIAALTLAGDAAFPELRAIFEADPRFQLPAEIN